MTLVGDDVSTLASQHQSARTCLGNTQGITFGHVANGLAPFAVQLSISSASPQTSSVGESPFLSGERGRTTFLVDASGDVGITNPLFDWASFSATVGTPQRYTLAIDVTDATGISAHVSESWTITATC